jgi:uncharacterized protein YndB with AHSA1/START domain
MEYRTSVLIAAPPERVWEVLLDVERWPEWTPSMTRVQRLDEGELRVGSRARVKQPRLPPGSWTVTELEPGRSFTWRSRSGGVTSEGVHGVEPSAEGSLATLAFRQTGLLAGLIAVLGGKQIRRYVDMELAGLKRRSEAEDGRPPAEPHI